MLLQDCDSALLRRFERPIAIPLPDAASRAAFLQSALSQPEMESDISPEQLQQLAGMTQGYSGSDLAAVCTQAAMAPVRAFFKQTKGLKRRRTTSTYDGHVACGTANLKACSKWDAELVGSHFSGEPQAQHQLVCTAYTAPAAVSLTSGMPLSEKVAAASAAAVCMAGAAAGGGTTSVDHLPELRKVMFDDFVKALRAIKPAMQDSAACMQPEP